MYLRKSHGILTAIFLMMVSVAYAQRMREEKPLSVIHFRINGSQILLPVTINHGQDTLHFLFDSGCEVNLLSLHKASELGIKGATDAGLSGWSNEMTYMPEARANSMSIGAVSIPDPAFYLEGLGNASVQGVPVDGVLGYDLLKRYIVKIDFKDRELSIYRVGNFRYPSGGSLLKLGMNYNTPTLEGTLFNDQGQPLTSTYHVVTGGNFGILLNGKYVEKYLLNKTLAVTGDITRQDLLQPVTYTECTVPSFGIGSYKLRQIQALYSSRVNDTAPDKEIAGAVGAEVWKQFTIILNLPGKELWMKRE